MLITEDFGKVAFRLCSTPHSRQPTAKSPHTKAQQAAGMRECIRSLQA